MSTAEHQGRWQQRRRTRKDLVEAAAHLLKQGKKPSLDEVALEADVSRATAYRYFPTIDALIAEAALHLTVPTPEELFKGVSDDPVARVIRVDAALQETTAQNETAMRLMLARSQERRVSGDGGDMPIRQNRRSPLIEAALAPARPQFGKTELKLLEAALAVIVGPDSWVVFRDVLQMKDEEAAKVRAWMIRSLISAAKKRN